MTTADQQASAKLTGAPTRHPASQAFHDLCDAMKAMHDKKQADYGRANDPFSNVRASEDFGIPGWAGAMMRANDKMRRIQKAASGGKLSNEGVEDSLMDLAVYSIIALVLYREERDKQAKAVEPMVRWDRPQPSPGLSPLELEKDLQAGYTPRGRFVRQENGEVWYVTDPEVGQ